MIRPTIKALQDRVCSFGLDPGTLLCIGIPDVVDDRLIGYDCCLEFHLPEVEDVKTMPGGRYAVLVVDKRSEIIVRAIRPVCGDYLPDHGLIQDEDRSVYETYYQDTMEYCVR